MRIDSSFTRITNPFLRDFCARFCSTLPIATTFIYSLADPRPDDTHVYIGKADKPSQRLNEHRHSVKFERTHKAFWFKQLAAVGLEPTLEVIAEVPFYQWQIWEVTLIHWYRVLGWNVVNTTDGGDGGAQDMTPEICAKISKANKGRKQSEDHKRRVREYQAKFGHPCKGKHLSAERRAQIGALFRGKKKSAETRAKMSASAGKHLKGTKLSPEHLAKLSAVKLGKKFTAEHRQRISASRKGIQFSAETKAKMRAAKVGRPLKPEHVAALRLARERKKQLTSPSDSASVQLSLFQIASNPT